MKKYKPLTKSSRQQYIINFLERNEVEYVIYGVTVGKQWEVATYFTEELAVQHAKDAQLTANTLVAQYGNDVPNYVNEFDKHMFVVGNFIEYIVETRNIK